MAATTPAELHILQDEGGAFKVGSLVVKSHSGKVEKNHDMLKKVGSKAAPPVSKRRPGVKYVAPSGEKSGICHFGTDVFLSAGLKPDHETEFVKVEQDENNDMVISVGEGGLPAGSYTIRGDFTGYVARTVLTKMIPAFTKQRKNAIRVASVVLPIIKFASGEEYLLLTQRVTKKSGTYNGIWVFPGGHVESGESLAEGGAREVFEETGLDLKVDDLKLLCVWQEFMASRRRQRQFLITNYYTVIQAEEGLDPASFLLTLGLQLKEVKRAVLLPRSTWGELATVQNKGFKRQYGHRRKAEVFWEDESHHIETVLGVESQKDHIVLTDVPIGEILGHSGIGRGIGAPHSFSVEQLLMDQLSTMKSPVISPP